MNPLQEALNKHTSAMNAMDDMREQNRTIFSQYERLANIAIGTRARLEDEAVAANSGIQNGQYEVKLIPQPQTFADIEVIDQLIAAGEIKAELRDKIVKTVERPPYVSIKKMGPLN